MKHKMKWFFILLSALFVALASSAQTLGDKMRTEAEVIDKR